MRIESNLIFLKNIVFITIFKVEIIVKNKKYINFIDMDLSREKMYQILLNKVKKW